MDHLSSILKFVVSLLPALVVLLICIAGIIALRKLFARQGAHGGEGQVRAQISVLALSIVGLIIIVIALPFPDSTRGQLLGLIGIVLSAVLALSATTFVGNALAGMMLRAVGSFRPGDFIRIGEHFGRVSERGLFHTEIQNEDRDLTTLPNLYLVTNPVKVVRSSGTIITAEVSLGYDIPHTRIEAALERAVLAAGLEDPFVLITKLGDFSVTYRLCGLLKEVKRVISSRSRLYSEMLDALHRDGIEIVSPTFMNTRAVADRHFIPRETATEKSETTITTPEAVVFDKAEAAASLEQLRQKLAEVETELRELESQKEGNADETWASRIKQLERRRDWLTETIRARESEEQ